jgi:hypothetical protein
MASWNASYLWCTGPKLVGYGDDVPNPNRYPPLKPLHPDASLSPVKLAQMERLSTDVLKHSLLPGQRDCLKTRPDGTVLDGHHRIHVLRGRGVDVDALPREINVKSSF